MGPEHWIFVLYAAPYRSDDGRIVVPFTIVSAPYDQEEDRRFLLPFTSNGWSPLVETTERVGKPIATALIPGRPGETFVEALALLEPARRQMILAPNVTPEYVPICTAAGSPPGRSS